jgi:hypothetical protein
MDDATADYVALPVGIWMIDAVIADAISAGKHLPLAGDVHLGEMYLTVEQWQVWFDDMKRRGYEGLPDWYCGEYVT